MRLHFFDDITFLTSPSHLFEFIRELFEKWNAHDISCYIRSFWRNILRSILVIFMRPWNFSFHSKDNCYSISYRCMNNINNIEIYQDLYFSEIARLFFQFYHFNSDIYNFKIFISLFIKLQSNIHKKFRKTYIKN